MVRVIYQVETTLLLIYPIPKSPFDCFINIAEPDYAWNAGLVYFPNEGFEHSLDDFWDFLSKTISESETLTELNTFPIKESGKLQVLRRWIFISVFWKKDNSHMTSFGREQISTFVESESPDKIPCLLDTP